MTSPTLGVVIFTVIELGALSLWLVGSGVHITPFGFVALALLLFFEHFVSYNVGTRQPWYRFPLEEPER